VLSDEVLDRIDAIVPPGADLYDPSSESRPNPWLLESARRRRPLNERAAA
jgi:hypothetical protein